MAGSDMDGGRMYRNWTALVKPSKVDFVGGGDPRYKATMVVVFCLRWNPTVASF